ncbi:MAG: hypothetical protein ABR971_03330 [Acidobacteriaceae bacterium]|jgi:hypothetical protein
MVIRRISLKLLLVGMGLSISAMVNAQAPSYNDLFSHVKLPSPMPDAAFGLPPGARAPSQVLEGRLDLHPSPGDGFGTVVDTKYNSVRSESGWKHLPPFSIDFVQDGNRIIPAQEGLILTSSLEWNLIVGHGFAWDQPGDHEYTRVALPFALIERNQNCVHNGELTFLFSNTKQPAISQVRYQITQETCDYMKINMWGQVPATYSHHSIAHADELKSSFQSEMEHRIPRKPLSDLAKDYPNAHFDLPALLRERKHPADATVYGLYVNGVNYASGCPTRYGEYAFCDEMRLPSYSTAKSAFAGMAMMHLGELFGPDVYSQKLKAYLPDVGQKNSWDAVAFTNVLDMSSGHFQNAGFEHDENGPEMKFLVDESLEDKLKDALLPFPSKVPPGTIWDYQSHNTFLATFGMQKMLKEKRGADADLFALMVEDIYKPLQISAGMMQTTRTDNSLHGSPAGFFGLFYIQDDVVKLARFLNTGDGVLEGKTVLDPKRLRESLFREPGTTGLTTNDPRQVADTVHYNHAFWGRHFTRLEYPQLSCDFWAPYMSGYGGISIVMLPNGITFYVFSDADEFIFNDAVLETNKLAPLCPAS